MNEWEMVVLGELGTFSGGVTSIKREDYGYGTPFLTYKNVYSNWRVSTKELELMNVPKKDLDRKDCKYGDVFFTASSETEDEVAMSSVLLENVPRLTFNGFCKRFRPHSFDRILPSFAVYWFRTRLFRGEVYQVVNGDTRFNINQAALAGISMPLPSIEEQEAIAEVLSSLDDKIDLLKRQNKTLEGMAEALFRQWFIEEAQDDWEEVPFGEVFDFTMGQSPPGDSFNETGIGVPMYQGNADFGMRFPTARVYTTKPKRVAGPGEVLMSVRAPVGAMNMAKEMCCIGRGVAAFRFKEFPAYDTYTLYKIKAMISDFMVFNEQGTVFGSIGKGDLLRMMVLSPPINLIKKFEAEAGPMDHKIRANANEIELLEKQRDTLLPKLMSGEVRVNLD